MKVRKLLAMLLVLTMVLSITLPTAVLAVEGDDAGATVTQTTESTQPDEGGDTATVPDEGDDTATVPDEGDGAVTVPDEGGDTATVPDEGGDTATVPDEGGDTTTVPDEGGDTTPAPSESADPTPAPSESTDPTPVPSESTDPTPVPSESTDPTPVPSESTDPTPVPSEGTDPTPVPSESTDPTPTPSESTVPAPTETVEIPEATVPGAALCEHGNDPAICPECAAMAVAKSVYEKIMAATTLEEYAAAKVVDPMYQSSIDALLAEYVATLTEDQQAAYAAQIAELEALLPPILSFETVEEIYAAIMAAETKADYDAILAAISDEQKAELDAYVLTLTEEEQAAYAEKVAALTASITDAEAIYNALMAAETLSDYLAIEEENLSTDELLIAFFMALTQEQVDQLGEKVAALELADDLAALAPPAVNYTDVAPFLPPVEGTAQTMLMASPMARMATLSLAPSNSPTAYSETGENPDGLEMNKTVTQNGDDYLITLEAYVTGAIESSSVTTAIPTDIVLVLDQSGSMDEDFATSSSSGYQKLNISDNDEAYSNRNNLYYFDGTEYHRVNVSKGSLTWNGYPYTYKWNNETVTSYRNGGEIPTPLRGNLYKFATTTTTTTKQKALKDAVEGFVESVQAQAAEYNVDHRIAIVGFASDNSRDGWSTLNYANTELLSTSQEVNYRNVDDSDYQDALVSANVNGQVNSRLSTAIDRIDAEGGTAINLGMEMAEKILDNNPVSQGEQRNRVVIVFTDGEPGIYNTDSDSTRTNDYANPAIQTAKSIKSTGVSVYSVGIFNGADASAAVNTTTTQWSDNRTTNRFMHYLSSNYPNATSMSNGGSKADDGYYLSAGDADALNEIFQKISDNIQTGAASIELGAETVVQDVISDKFQLPEETTANDIRVYTMDATSTGGWTNKQPLSSNGVTIDGDTIQYTGFDFSNNFVSEKGYTEGNPNAEGNFYGRKLVIEIPIEVKDGFFGGNNIDTNADGSAIYANAAALTADEPTGTFTSPNLNVPVKYKIDVQDQSIYLTQNGDGETLIDYVETGTDGVSYVPNGWNNSKVTITYTVKKGNTTIGTYTIRPSQTSGSWTWEDGYDDGVLSGLTDCTKFNISCTVTPNDGTNDSAGQNVVDSSTTDNEEATVHVFKPTVSFKDQSTYLTVDPLKNQYDVQWVDGKNDGGTTPNGNKPNLVLTEQVPDNTTLDNYVKTVTATVEGYTGTINVQANTTFVRTACEGDAALSNANEFYVHVFKPQIKWTDSKEDYGTVLTNGFLEGHQVDEVTWTHDNSDNVSSLLDPSEKPTLVYEFKTPNGSALPSTLQAETNVKVTVKVGGADITEDTTFSWRAGEGCPDTCSDPNDLNPAYQFRIHLNNFDLTVTKVVSGDTYDADDNFLFTLYQGDDVYATFTLQAGKSVTFKNLQAGHEYRVVESVGEDSWSWRYTCDDADQEVTDIQNGTARLTFTNTLSEDQWLSDEARAENDFDASAGVGVNARMGAALVPEKPKMPGDQDADNEERS